MIRQTIRALAKSPGFSIAAILTLALGIGGNTAMFSLVNAVLLRPLPYKDPDRLVALSQSLLSRGGTSNPAAAADFVDWRKRARSFQQMAAVAGVDFNLMIGDRPNQVHGLMVSPAIFATLGVAPAIGRGFSPEEEKPGANHFVVLGDALWRRRFGADRNVLGETIMLDQQPYTVTGVMPPGFWLFGHEYELLTPLVLDPDRSKPAFHYLLAMARLKPDVTLAQARFEMDAIARQLSIEYPKSNQDFGAATIPLTEQLVGDIRLPLLIFMGAVAFVLLIACSNVANLLLVRASGRQTEFAIRAVLGAGRADIVRRLLGESLLLALAGGALGILIAQGCMQGLIALSPGDIPRLEEVGIDPRVLVCTLFASLLAGILFGLAPAAQLFKIDLHDALKQGSRGASGATRGGRTRALFVIAQVALALVLLVGAGLMIRSFAALLETNTGFHSENLLTMNVTVQPGQYASEPLMAADFERVAERIRSLPGVLSATAATNLPGVGWNQGRAFTIAGHEPPKPGVVQGAGYMNVSPSYFRTAGIPLLRGRDFTAQDRAGAPDVIIISDAMARHFFPRQNPIGQRIVCASLQFRSRSLGVPIPREIVGVVGSVHDPGLDPETSEEMYTPQAQNVLPFTYFILRTSNDPARLATPAAREINSVLKDSAVTNVKTMDQRLSESFSRPRFQTLVLGAFAGVALLLATIGIYGVMAYSVSQRRQEIGIRMALGADSGSVLRLVLGNALRLAAIGVALGLAGAYAATRVLASFLHGVQPHDALTFGAVTLVIVATSVLASLIPALRAAQTDPARTLQGQV